MKPGEPMRVQERIYLNFFQLGTVMKVPARLHVSTQNLG